MSWDTLRDFIDTRWAAAVAGYTGTIRTALKAGPVTGIAQGIYDEGIGLIISNLFDESYTFAADTALTDRQACV